MSRMRAATAWTMLAAAMLLLGGCGQRKDDSGEKAAEALNVPNDSGGFAKDLGAPPDKPYKPDIDRVIKEGSDSDSTRAEKLKEAEEARKAAEKHKLDPPSEPTKDQPKAEPSKEAPVKSAPVKPDASLKLAPKNTQGDGQYKANKKPVVALQTKAGVIYLELWPDVAPKHCEQILRLVGDGFYDGILVHRIVPGFVVQAGDPLTRKGDVHAPAVGSGGSGHMLKAEFSAKPHNRGTLSMARANDPDSADSQFFICLTREQCAQLDGKYTVFGQVLGKGMDLADKMSVGDRIEHMWRVNK